MNRIRIKSEDERHKEVEFNNYVRVENGEAKNYKVEFKWGPPGLCRRQRGCGDTVAETRPTAEVCVPFEL